MENNEIKLPIGPQYNQYPYQPNELVVHIATGIKMWIGGFPEQGIVECRLPNLDIRRFFITEIMPYEMFIEQRGEDKLAKLIPKATIVEAEEGSDPTVSVTGNVSNYINPKFKEEVKEFINDLKFGY